MDTTTSDPIDDLLDEIRLMRSELALLRESIFHMNRLRMGADWERRERYGW